MGMPIHDPPAEHRWTAAEVRALEDPTGSATRYECVDGQLLVTPAPSFNHQEAGGLYELLRDYLREQRVGHAYLAPGDVEFAWDTLVQPDLFVVPLIDGKRPRAWDEVGRLLLAVEVLSPGSARHDRGVKRRLYQRRGVPESWIVDLDARVIERWRPSDERAEQLDARIAWRPDGASEALIVDLVRYFATVLDESRGAIGYPLSAVDGR